jgi:hypothetical protein
MTPEVEGVLETAKSLERGQIADLAFELLRVLDNDAPELDQRKVDAVWRAEFRRRVEDIETGKVRLASHEETVSEARAMLAARRK